MKLHANAIIDIVAPSSPPQNMKWKRGIQILQSWGFYPRWDKNILSPWMFHSCKNSQRSQLLNQAFSNKDSSIVWILRGGYGLQKLMPSFIKNPCRKKLFIGYSDGTALHLYLNGQNWRTLHAPSVAELSDLPRNNLTLLKSVLLGRKKEITFKNLGCLNPPFGKTLKAKITGGNLSLLSSSVGAPWFASLKRSHFLFIEDVKEEDYKVDRLLHHLFYAGALKKTKALLFGGFPPLSRMQFKKVLKNFSEVCPIPMLFGLPCGHQIPHHPLPFQTPAKLSFKTRQGSLTVSFELI